MRPLAILAASLLAAGAGAQVTPTIDNAAASTARAASDAARLLDRQATDSARARLERRRPPVRVDPSFYVQPDPRCARTLSASARRAASCRD